MSYYIYKITNLVNHKIYIGQTGDLKKRWSEHKSAAKVSKNTRQIVTQAIKKYGPENFSFELVEVCSSIEDANFKESSNIISHNSMIPNGYNIENGGRSGNKMSDESKKKLSKSMIGNKNGSNSFLNHKHTEEAKRKVSAARKGKKLSLEHRVKLSEAHKGKTPWNKGIKKR